MYSVRVIPCLDVDNGRVVKGVKFEGLRDAGDPVELATRYDAEGADELVFYDITASSQDRDTILDVVQRTAACVFIPLTVGGGVRQVSDARALLRAGADKVSINSAAVARPDLIHEIATEFGSQCAVLGVDVRRMQASTIDDLRWEVVTRGGRNVTNLDALAWCAEAVQRGAGEIVVNSIDRDGTLAGYDLELLQRVTAACNVPVVASGGVGTLQHLIEGATVGHADAVLAASIFHFGTHTIEEAKTALTNAGVTVRPVYLPE